MSLEEKKEFTFLWEIKNFSFCTPAKGDFLVSPVFDAEILDETSWYISLFPRGDGIIKDGHMSCYLFRCENDGGPAEIVCEFEIQIIISDETILKSGKISSVFQKGDLWYFPRFWKKSNQFLNTKEVFKLRCNLKQICRKKPIRPVKPLCSERLGSTKIGIDKCSFKWIVKKLNSNCSEVIKFPYTETSQVEISVQVPEDDVKITIRKTEAVTEPLAVMCRITLLDLEGKKHDSREALHFFETKDAWVFPDFLKKSKLNAEKEDYLKDDCVTLQCKLAVSNGTQTSFVKVKECGSPGINLVTGPERVLEDMKRLYKDKIHSDVRLLVEGQIIQAHKNILSIRSPVFMAMFGTEMVENETGTVIIPDMDAETVSSLLEYMYTGTVEKINCKIATKLIVAADKYQVLHLKEKCADFMQSIFSYANVCEVLVVADLIQHKTLKSAAISYIKEHSEHIFFTDEWNHILLSNLHLATEVVGQVAKFIAANQNKTANK